MASSADDTSAQQPIEDTEDLVYKARLAEQAERYDEMADLMKKVAQMKKLSVEERNLLSVAFKNAVGARRASWRIMSSVETKQKSKQNDQQVKLAASYRKTVEDELHKICQDILELLDKSLIPGADDAESKVFYYKMKGDYYRYISEFSCDKQKAAATEAANEAYEEATRIASQELTATHPIRLGLALNFSVFFYEIMGKPRKACEMAHCAFEDALPGLEHVCEESYRDSTLIMQLLRDNLALWTSDTAAAEKEQPPNQGAGAPQAAPAVAGGEAAPAPQAPAGETPESSRKEM